MACCAFAIVLLGAVLGVRDELRARLNWLLGVAPPKPNPAVAWEFGMAEAPAATGKSATGKSMRKPLVQTGFAAIAAAALAFLIFHDHGAHARDERAWIFDDICIGIEQAKTSTKAAFSAGE
jgi:hypothetical protein